MAYRGGGGGGHGGGDPHQRYGGGERGDPAGGRRYGRARTGWPPPGPSSSVSRPATPAPYTAAITLYHNPNATGPHQGVVFHNPAPPPYAPSPSTASRASSSTLVTIRAPCPTPATFHAPPPTPTPAAAPFQPAGVSAPASYAPSPSTVRASSSTPVSVRAPPPMPSPAAAPPFQPARVSAPAPYAPSPSTVRASSSTPVIVRAPPPTPSPAAAPPFQTARVSAPAPAPAPPTPTPSTAAVAKELALKLFVTETALAPAAAAAAATQVAQPAAEKAPEVDAPVSKKGLAHPALPSAGTVGKEVMIRANHFLVSVADNNLFHYDVSINLESKSKAVNKEVLSELIKLHGKTSLGGKLPAYDGRKSLYTAGSLPFESEEFSVTVVHLEKKDKERTEREYKITIRIAGRTDLYHLQQFLKGRQRHMPQENIQVLDVVLRESPSWNYVTVSRSFFSTTFDHRGDIGEGLECWRDISATSFFNPVTVQFVLEFLNLRDALQPLTDRDIVKRKKALCGVRVEPNHRQDQIRRYKITGITPISMSHLIFPVDERGARMSVVQYFMQRYNYNLQYTRPCLQSGSDARPVYLPMEACKIVEGQRYSKKLNDRQVTNILRATCQRPQQREQSIREMVLHNKHAESRPRVVIREVELIKLDGKITFGGKLPAYDGRKSLCSAGSLQERAEREYKITIHKMISGATIDNLENGAPKINVKIGEQNIVLERAPMQNGMPFVSKVPEVIVGADATAYTHGEDSALSAAPVVASMDRLEIANYGGLTSAQPYMQEVLEDLFNLNKDSQRVNANGGNMNELLITFRRKTGRRPERIVFRDGVNEGQFCQVLLHETDRIRKACASFEDEYIPPVNFVVDQKKHRTRLFPKVHVRHVTLNGNLNSGVAVSQEGPPHHQPKLGPFIQLFVDLNGRRVPVRPQAEATLGSAVAEAMFRTNCQIKDFYVVNEQRSLDLDQAILLQKLVPNSTVQVRPRVRGGVDQIEMSFTAVKFEDRIQSFTSEELFEERTVKAELLGLRTRIRPGRTGKGKEHVMRKSARQIVHQLFQMIHLLHLRGISLNGNFMHEHVFYLPLLDSYFIPEAFIEANGAIYTPFGYEKDMNALGRILEKIFSWKFDPSKRGVYPVHVQHLIQTLKSLPVGARNSGAFRAFLRNHVAMLSPGAVQGLILEVHRYIKYQPENLQQSTSAKLGSYQMKYGNLLRWTDVPRYVHCFNEVHTYQKYTLDKTSWFDFLRNFVSHPNDTKPPNFTMEEVDLAFAYHFDEGLPEFFCDLVMGSTFVSSHTIESVFDRDYFNMKFFEANAESIASTSGS